MEHYITTMHGVGITDPGNGILTERVWSITGPSAASSVSTLTSSGYSHHGRLRMLEHDEAAAVGASVLTAPPGRSVDDLPPWTPLPSDD